MAILTKYGVPVIYVANARYSRKRFVRRNNRLALPEWMVQAERFINKNTLATWPILNNNLLTKDKSK